MALPYNFKGFSLSQSVTEQGVKQLLLLGCVCVAEQTGTGFFCPNLSRAQELCWGAEHPAECSQVPAVLWDPSQCFLWVHAALQQYSCTIQFIFTLRLAAPMLLSKRPGVSV